MPVRQVYIIEFVNRSFRDVADQDYLAARILYRYDLRQPFLWSAMQAVEKYIKAILLYNGKPTNDLRHNIEKGFRRLATIAGIPFKFPDDISDFIKYLNEQGPNRYFEYPSSLHEDALLGIDRVVWYLRRYSYYMRGQMKGSGGALVDRLPYELEALKKDPLEYRHKFRIQGGYLEKVLAGRSELRRHLVWKNFFYGAIRKRTIKAFPHRMAWAKPTHFMRPQVYDELKHLVQFSDPVRQYFEQLKTAQKDGKSGTP